MYNQSYTNQYKNVILPAVADRRVSFVGGIMEIIQTARFVWIISHFFSQRGFYKFDKFLFKT